MGQRERKTQCEQGMGGQQEDSSLGEFNEQELEDNMSSGCVCVKILEVAFEFSKVPQQS